ncbi:MAG: IS4 family transposase [Kiritimatiellae bacterium]|nr:IS4 family transposase [Kiritimatiellia bacterium]
MKTFLLHPTVSACSSAVLTHRLREWVDCGTPPPGSRNRRFPPPLVAMAWLLQCLFGNISCENVLVRLSSALRLPCPLRKSAYVQARERLTARQVAAAERSVAAHAGPAACAGLLRNRPLKALDGVDFRTLDTPENRKKWSYPSGQKPGCGFPVLGCMAVRVLATGQMLALTFAKWSVHDLRLFFRALARFAAGDILVADRAFDAFVFYAALARRGVDAVCRVKSHRRDLSKLRKIRLGSRRDAEEWAVRLHRPKQAASISRNRLAELPPTLELRLIHTKIRVRGFRDEDLWLMTTLADAKAYPAGDILRAYRMRWEIELGFRDLKTSMEAEFLRYRTPEMVVKGARFFFLANNFLQLLVRETLGNAVEFLLSFKGTLPVMAEILVSLLRGEEMAALVAGLVPTLESLRHQRRKRPSQPRAVKQRPKPYAILNKPRHEYQATFHRNRYRKDLI